MPHDIRESGIDTCHDIAGPAAGKGEMLDFNTIFDCRPDRTFPVSLLISGLMAFGDLLRLRSHCC